MFEPRLESSYGNTGNRYALIGEETTPCFQVKKSVINGIAERAEDSFYIGVVTAGSCAVTTSGSKVELGTYDKFFCPAGLESYTIEAQNEVQILECFPPAPEQ
jgi:mannose-6-phosphate isomerase